MDLRKYLIDSHDARPVKGKATEVTMDCPECGKGTQHFNFNIVKMKGNCYSCSYKPYTAVALLTKILSISNNQAKTFLVTGSLEGGRRSSALAILDKSYKPETADPDELHLNAAVPEEFIPMVDQNRKPSVQIPLVFKERGYYIGTIEQLKIGFCKEGPYTARLIFPIQCAGMTSFYARRIFDYQAPKFKNPPGSKHSQLLYNYDNIPEGSDRIIVCEGCTDVCRLTNYGWHAVASSGKKISGRQVDLLVDKKPKEVVALFDGDAIKENRKAFQKLSYRLNAALAFLPKKGDGSYFDPDDAPRELLIRAIKNRVGTSRLQDAIRILNII